MTFFPGVRLHVVTGKGGTGKTTIAAALAVGMALRGQRVLVAEVEGRQGLAPLFGQSPLPYAEVRLARLDGGGEVHGLAVDPDEALVEYLEMFYHLGRAGKLLRRMGAVDFVTSVAPGLRDVLLIGKVKEAVSRRRGAGPHYDAVVLDAPPTGRIVRFLGATGEVSNIARMGPIKTQSDAVMALLRSSQTAIHLVTLLEEMPVQETVDGAKEIRAAGLPLGAVLVNRVRPAQLPGPELDRAADGELDLDAISAALTSVGIDPEPGLLKVLSGEAAEHARRIRLEEQQRRDLEAIGIPVVDLPLVSNGIDLGALYDLGDDIVSAP